MRALVTGLALLCFLAASCSLARGTLAPGEQPSGMDAHVEGVDTGPRPDTGVPEDAFIVPDAFTHHDADGQDAPETADAFAAADAFTPVDASAPPDAFAPDDAFVPEQTCTEVYRDRSDGFILCGAELDANCTFYVRLGSTSCGALCGAACRGAVPDSADGCAGTPTPDATCEAPYGDVICVCARTG